MKSTSVRCLPALVCGLAFAMGAQAGRPAQQSLSEQWRDYARQRISPAFAWARTPVRAAPNALTPFRNSEIELSFDIALAGTRQRLPMLTGDAADAAQTTGAPSPLSLFAGERSALSRDVFTSSLEHALGDNSRLSLSAILAHQRYASPGLGLTTWQAPDRIDFGSAGGVRESSTGGGVRLAYRAEASSRLSYALALQSKIDMEPFKAYRGVFSDPGDFDLPGLASASFHYALTPDLTVGAGVERVFYSNIAAFTSASLPVRFLALLGDGSSPVFAWRDLDVYSLEARYGNPRAGEWTLRYTTRQQPDPTSELLQRALESEYANLNLTAGYRRELGRFGSLWLAASYAPSRYFLGASPYAQRNLDVDGSQIEVEALWSMAF